jgi:threonine dehydrogenase-like Zn-dependent dehydrogenase
LKIGCRYSSGTGALVEFLSVAWHAVRVAGVDATSSAFIVGAGPIGLALLLALKANGLTNITVSELSEQRKELARSLGADVIDPRETDVGAYAHEKTGGSGVDVAFDASGVGAVTFNSGIAALRNGGTTVVVANFHDPVAIDLSTLMQAETRILGSLAYTRADFEEVIAAVIDGRIDPAPLVTSEIELADIVDKGLAYLLTGGGRETEVKVLVNPRS